MDDIKTLIAKDLLEIKAVFFRPDQPFIWASGIKSPVYCDNRLTLTSVKVRGDVENGLAELISREYPDAEVLMGTSTAGIAHAAITAHIMSLPMGYVRSGNKDHGRQNRIEGKLEPGQKTVVVEDLISTGGSVLEVVEALREAGANVLGIASIFTSGGRTQRQSYRFRRGGKGGGAGKLYPSRGRKAPYRLPRQSVGRKLDKEGLGICATLSIFSTFPRTK